MKTCFVIQRFDAGVYDKRYRETFAPAIERGGAKPMRADEVLGTKPVVEKIEQGLQNADVAFAEISEENANVFLELGYALALDVPTVIVCDRGKRQSLPFDIAHRPVTFYITDAQSDYEKISKDVEHGIKAALLESGERHKSEKTSETGISDIDQVADACLLELLDQSLQSPVGNTLWQIQKEVSSAGISERMVSLAVAILLNDNLIVRHELTDLNGEQYSSYALSEHGQKHILRSYSSLMVKEKERALLGLNKPADSIIEGSWDDEIPF